MHGAPTLIGVPNHCLSSPEQRAHCPGHRLPRRTGHRLALGLTPHLGAGLVVIQSEPDKLVIEGLLRLCTDEG